MIADGAFTASGVDIISNTSDTLTFRGGAFRLIHSPGHGKQSFDPRTCLLTVRQHGTYRLSHGTGSYAGIRGHGRYVLSLLAIAARNPKGNCSQTCSQSPPSRSSGHTGRYTCRAGGAKHRPCGLC